MASDIAYLIEELNGVAGQPLKFLITGLPDNQVLLRFREVPIEITDLHRPKRTSRYKAQAVKPPSEGFSEEWNWLTGPHKVLVLVGICIVAFGGINSLDSGELKLKRLLYRDSASTRD
ncbi:hypothetical protein BDQ17DRAFT_1428586 [Cyathus striatus]|nr:hypothetical protein BDQ17DRAFT_1428586 [Cyathus striatus]